MSITVISTSTTSGKSTSSQSSSQHNYLRLEQIKTPQSTKTSYTALKTPLAESQLSHANRQTPQAPGYATKEPETSQS